MGWLKQFDLLLFDFDGLLVDTESLHHLAYEKTLAEHGCELGWDFDRYAGFAHRDRFALRDQVYREFPELLEKVPEWETIRQEKNACYLDLLESAPVELMPGVKTLLEEIADEKPLCSVVTNSTQEQISRVKKWLPILDVIPLWLTRDEYKNPKPAPDGYLQAIEELGGRKERMMGFEDTLKGAQALLAADVPAYLICKESHPQLNERPQNLPHATSFEVLPL